MAGVTPRGGSSGTSGSAPVSIGNPLDPNILGSNQGQVAFAQAIARLQYSGGDQKATADELFRRYGGNIDPAVIQAAGVRVPQGAKEGNNVSSILWDTKRGSGGGVLGTLGNWFGRPVQATMAGLRDVGVAAARGVHNVTGLGHAPNTENSGFGNIGKALTGHGNMDPFSMIGGVTAQQFGQNFAQGVNRLGLGTAPGAGVVKAAAPAFFTAAAQTGLDPFIGIGGASSEARVAKGILEAAGQGEEAAQLGRAGFRSFAPDVQEGLKSTVANSPQVARIAEGKGLIGPGFEDARAALASKYTDALKQARGGVHLYGKSILPRDIASKAFNLVPGMEEVRGATRAAFNKIAPVFSNEARLTQSLGPEAAKAIPDIRRGQQAAVNLAAKDAITQFKGFQDLAPEEQAAIARGMERGSDYASVVRPTLSPEAQDAMDAFINSRSQEYLAKGSEEFQIDQAVKKLASTPEELEQVKQEAFDVEKARLSDEAQAPIAKAEPAAQAARRYADSIQNQLDNVRADYMAKEAELGKGKVGYGATKRLGIMEERAAVAEKDAVTAEQKLTTARENFRAAHDSSELGISPIDKQATEAANAARDKIAQSRPFLKSEDTYLRHRFTPQGTKLVKQLKATSPDLYNQMKGDIDALSAGGSLKNRVIQGELPDANKAWADILTKGGIDVPKDAQILEKNIAMIAAHSSVETKAAIEEMRALAQLSKIPNAEGTAPLIIAGDTTDEAGNVITAAERAKELGYKAIDSRMVKEVYGHPNLIPELKNLNAVTTNDAALRQFQKFFRAWDSQWSRITTSFSIAKRYVGHLFNSFLAGAADPQGFVDAFKAQQADRAISARLGQTTGAEWEEAMVKSLGERNAGKYFEARKAGIGATGYMPQNIPNTLEREMGQGGNFNPFSQNFKPLAKLGDVNQAIDNNVRLGHFFNAFEKSGDYKQAADSVYKYLFDYSDLTPTEQKLKQYARFYTYLRKNTPLQVLGMIEKPGLYSTAFRAKGALAQSLPAAPGPYAQYALEAGGVPTSQGVLGMDMPFEHAVKFATPALQLAAMTPGVGKLLPESFHPEGGFGEVARNFASNFAGGPMSAAKVLVEQMTGRSLQSGAPISQDTYHRYWQVLNQLVPVTSKANAVLNPRGGGMPIGILGKLLNVTVTPINDKSREQELKREARLVSDAIAKYNANGPKVVTTDELRSAGVIPSAQVSQRILGRAGIKTHNTAPKKTAAQKRQEALKKIKI